MTIDLDLLLRAYGNGYFPMSDARDDPDIFWVEPKLRAIMPLDGLKISKSLAKAIRQDRFRVTTNKVFDRVIALCAEPADGREDTWINAEIEEAFKALNALGFAHSIECWLDGDEGPVLAGGLYGLALGGAFFGESMFSRATDASKIALVWLVARLRLGGFQLLDCQFITGHLASLGAIEISQQDYLALLAPAVGLDQAYGDHVYGDQTEGSGDSSSSDGAGSAGPDWDALDGFLGAPSFALPDGASGAPFAAALVPEAAGGGGISSSPGKFILHSFTQTS